MEMLLLFMFCEKQWWIFPPLTRYSCDQPSVLCTIDLKIHEISSQSYKMFLQFSIINEALTTLSTISAANINNDNNFVSLDPETVSSVIKLKRIFSLC